MTKKIFDVLPPKILRTQRLKKEKIKFEDQKFTLPKFEFKKLLKIKISLKLVFSSFLFILIFSLFLLSFKFSKAQIKIWPQTEDFSLKEKLVLDTKIEKVDKENKSIPAKIIEIEEEFSGEFLATGKVLKKAQGIIRLFNEYTTRDEVWLAGTRFMSAEGKLFKSKHKIFVPGAKIEEGKIVPSFVDVEVEATEGGAEYNIGPSDFSIVAFKGTPRYFKYYGKSFEPMKGGGEFPQIQKEDLEKAEKELIEKAKEKAPFILQNKVAKGFSILKDSILVEVLEKSSDAKEGEEKEKFNFKIRAKIKAIYFSKEDLSNFAKEYLEKKLPPEREIYLPSLKIDFQTEVVNFDLGKASISLEVFARLFPKLDDNFLKKALAEKKLSETKVFLMAQPQFSKAKIEIFPFWAKNLPSDFNRIEIIYPLID